ncbi:putative ribonuclease H-like domain-containing protein, partial [Tanacetum coccineum]
VEKALYGLHQAPKAWYETLSTYLLENRFRRGTIDKTLFIKKDKASTLIETNKALNKDEEAEDVDVHLYRSMIGSLVYLTASRPDIMFVVCACARFQVTPKTSHLHVVKRIFRYLKGQPKLGLWYPRDSPFDKPFLIVTMLELALIRNPQQEVVNFLTKDETVYKEWEDRMERAATTASSLEAEHDSGNINRTQFMATLNESFPQGTDSGSGPRVNTLRSGEDIMKLMELMELYTKLSERILDNKNRKSDLVKTVNGERQIQALVDKKKVIIFKTSIKSDFKLDDAEGTDCLPTAIIFAELERMGYENLTQKLTFYKTYFSSQWKFLIHTILQFLSAKTTAWNEFSSTIASAIICLATNQKFNFSMYIFDNLVKNLNGGVKFYMYLRFVQVFLDKQVEGMSRHKGIYDIPSHTKKVFANMKRPGKGFSGKVTPLFATMMVQATEDMGEDSAAPTDFHSTPIHTNRSSLKP